MHLIALCGKARSGKDIAAEQLVAQHGFTRIAFADPLKHAAQHIFGLTHAQTWDDALKEVVIPLWGLTPRQIFQKLGTEAIRGSFGEDVWVKRWKMSYDSASGPVVVPDCRFDSEASALREMGGVLIEVQRGLSGLNGSEGDNASERGLSCLPNIVIDNNGSVERFRAMVGTLPSIEDKGEDAYNT